MNSEHPSHLRPSPRASFSTEDANAPSSRLLDEKVSDDSGAEAITDSALRPAGLKNPFWSKASA